MMCAKCHRELSGGCVTGSAAEPKTYCTRCCPGKAHAPGIHRMPAGSGFVIAAGRAHVVDDKGRRLAEHRCRRMPVEYLYKRPLVKAREGWTFWLSGIVIDFCPWCTRRLR